MNRLSIKARITIWYTLITFIVSVAALGIMTSASYEILIRDSERKLVSVVERTIPMVTAPKSEPMMSDRMEIPRDHLRKLPGFLFFNDGVHTAIYDANGNIIGGALPFEFADEIEFENETIQEKLVDGRQHLNYAKKIQDFGGNTCWLVGVISIADESTLIKSVIKTNSILVIILVLVAAIGGYLILKQAFKPVNKISNTAKLISESNDLSQRIALRGGNDEIHALANTFDEMLTKIEKTFENEKQFTSDASHELRTPVAVIASECEYALECATTLEETKESVQTIKQQTDKITKLISALLELTRMDKGITTANYENLNISELLHFICDEQEEVNGGNITLTRDIAENVFAVTDSILLTRIIANLISNAYSYGKEHGNIVVSLRERQHEIVLEVADDGIGIAEEDLSKIWERFYQVDSARTNEKGNMGLGLSMVKLAVEQLAGTITVKSKLGEGTTFTFIMPKEK